MVFNDDVSFIQNPLNVINKKDITNAATATLELRPPIGKRWAIKRINLDRQISAAIRLKIYNNDTLADMDLEYYTATLSEKFETMQLLQINRTHSIKALFYPNATSDTGMLILEMLVEEDTDYS